MKQQGDVKLFQTPDDGEISIVNGVTEMSGGLETAAYLSLFGGNDNDDGSANSPFSWWGNLSEVDPAKQYRSETQNLLRSLPAIPFNLRRIEDASERDLAWMIPAGVATTIAVTATIPGVNKIRIVALIDGDIELVFLENWKAEL